MAGSLIKLDEEILDGTVTSVTLGNTNWDSSFNVYMCILKKVEVTTDQTDIKVRFLESGTPNTTANYDSTQYHTSSNQAFNTQNEQNATSLDLTLNIGNSTGEQLNSIIYIFNANVSGTFTFMTQENSMMSNAAELRGKQGGGALTVNSAINGIQFIESMDSGIFSLYGIKN